LRARASWIPAVFPSKATAAIRPNHASNKKMRDTTMVTRIITVLLPSGDPFCATRYWILSRSWLFLWLSTARLVTRRPATCATSDPTRCTAYVFVIPVKRMGPAHHAALRLNSALIDLQILSLVAVESVLPLDQLRGDALFVLIPCSGCTLMRPIWGPVADW
jgi:hypothetical protein